MAELPHNFIISPVINLCGFEIEQLLYAGQSSKEGDSFILTLARILQSQPAQPQSLSPI
jgi:hypothetical protein